ncbi:MAG: hypothetical protein H6R19_2479 [Proteobacteria bacterium]|nr:hypothetical protein [Pseudomonadota bacterium]
MYHPFLASTDDPYIRLVRAYLWQILDADFRHAGYWRNQVLEAEKDFLDSVNSKSQTRPVQLETLQQLRKNALVSAFEVSAMRKRQAVPVPSYVSFSRSRQFYGKTYSKRSCPQRWGVVLNAD